MRCLLAETGPTGTSLAIPPSLKTTGAAWTAANPPPPQEDQQHGNKRGARAAELPR